jgi:Flp pilus assembly protein TadG
MRARMVRGARRPAERGSQLVEMGLIAIPFFAFLFLLVDTSWALFVKATLQHAACEGVRYAVTGNTLSGQGQVASIESVVQSQAMGLLSGENAATVHVRFYQSDTLAQVSSNVGGNLVIVSIEGYALRPLTTLLHSGDPIMISVSAGDVIEPSPNGTAPAL